jgi:hypothetical protein
LSENLIQNDGVEIPAKMRRPVVVPIEAHAQRHNAEILAGTRDPDFVVAISYSVLRKPAHSARKS